MKGLIIAFCLVARVGFSQSSDETTLPVDESGHVQFQQVVKVDSAESTKTIIGKARSWVAKTFNSASTVVQQYDPDQGILIVKGASKFSSPQATFFSGKTVTTPAPYLLRYTLTIESKPGRYRSTINSLTTEIDGPGGSQYAQPLVAKPPTLEESNQLYQTAKISEKMKRENASLNVENQTRLLKNARQQIDLLNQSLEKALKQGADKEKGW